MLTQNLRDEILIKFCDRFDGREKEMVNPLIVRGELLMIANAMEVSLQDVALVLKEQLDEVLDG